MLANPFETPKEVREANIARVKAKREALDEVRGFGNPGVIGDAINNTIGERIMDSESVTDVADRVFEDPNATLGSLAVSVTAPIRGRHQR